jgi:epoxyqueuosine reductase QueG
VAKLFRAHAYDQINQRLDHILSRLSSLLQRGGHRTLPVPATGVVHGDLLGIFSNKMAASLAGLGWIGKSCLLVTPQVGPRARWGALLTDAPLTPTGRMIAPRCGDCHACADACPSGAILGRLFDPAEPREMRFSAQKCNAYMLEAKRKVGVRVCGMCAYICPHGRQKAGCANCG